jgi:hypothetical protein
VWAESVVVEVEVLEGFVGGQEGDEGGLCIDTEGVIAQIDRSEVREV